MIIRKKAAPEEASVVKENAITQRKVDIVKAKGEELCDTMKYDLSANNMLF